MAGSALKRLMAEYKRIFYICLSFFVKFSVISFRDMQILNSGRFGPIFRSVRSFRPDFRGEFFSAQYPGRVFLAKLGWII